MKNANVYPHRVAPAVHRPAPGAHRCAPQVPAREFVLKEYVDRLIAEVKDSIEGIEGLKSLPPATRETLGGVIIGDGLDVDASGVISVSGSGFTPTEEQRKVLLSGITAEKVSTYDGYATSKQDALSAEQMSAVNSGVTAKKLADKVDKVEGKGLSANDYTTTEKEKLAGIEAGAQKNPDLSDYAKKTELAAKRDRADNIAAEDGKDWKISYEVYSGSEDLKLKLYSWVKNNPPLLQWDDEFQRWFWSNLPDLDGYYLESEDFGEGYARAVFVSDTDLHGYGVVGERVTVTKSGEPYITHGYVNKRMDGLAHDTVGMLLFKRDKTDNIAAKDEAQFTEWKFRCDEPAIQAALDASSLVVEWSGLRWDVLGLPSVDGWYIDANYSMAQEDALTIVVPAAYVNPDMGLAVSVTATREKMTITKQGEPYVTPTGVPNIAIPKYEFADRNLERGDGDNYFVTLEPYVCTRLQAQKLTWPYFQVVVGGDSGKTRGCILVVDCGGMELAPTVTWPVNFHPRTDAATDFACMAEVRNVYWITEYTPGEFAVAGWQETEGGNA